MIVTKQRRQSQSSYQSRQIHNNPYSPFNDDKQNLFRSTNQYKTQLIDNKQPSYYHRQRNSIGGGSVSKVNNTKNYFTPYESSKKSQKKYDYSAAFQQQQHEKYQLNKTHNNSIEYEDQNNRKSFQKHNYVQNEKSYLMDDKNDKRSRCSSVVKNSIPKYKYNNSYMLSQQKQQQVIIPKSSVKLTNYHNTHDVNQFYVMQNPKYTSSSSAKPSRHQNYEFTANKENRPTNNTKAFFSNDNFSATNKLIEFKTNDPNSAAPKPTSKYEPKYSRMRTNNKRSQIINKSYQYLQNQPSSQLQQINKNIPTIIDNSTKPSSINFQQLYKNSQTDNKKLTQKINRITQLNSQINRRLQKMLLGKNLV